ncbi:MAG: SpoIVB peptidase [Clostridia bacterium]|nr:SpoIVB peptidase [Clostridia bacterium]
MKKILIGIFLLIILTIIYIYTLAIYNIPDSIIIFEGETIKVNNFLGFSIGNSDKTIETSSSSSKTINNAGKTTIEVSLFDNFFIKNMEVDVLPRTKVIPSGNIAGVKLYTSGILVVGMSEIEGEDNKKHKPYENSGIEEGDSIISIDNTKISTTQDLIDTVNASSGKDLAIEYVHNNATATCSITPVKTSNNEYKLGLWVRDSAAGVGTVTFYDPSTKCFGALGHGITDIDTEELINIESGEFITTQILNIKKGETGNPGRIQGTIDNQTNIGTISKNTKFGIYGKVSNPSALKIDSSKEMEVALREEIKEGPAKILCNLDGSSTKEYDIKIERIYRENNYDNKSMKIKVTDEELLNKTGGIIQGMSGSPIIQNGKFVGAITHVLVNNPKEGYAVFADIMLKQIREVQT